MSYPLWCLPISNYWFYWEILGVGEEHLPYFVILNKKSYPQESCLCETSSVLQDSHTFRTQIQFIFAKCLKLYTGKSLTPSKKSCTIVSSWLLISNFPIENNNNGLADIVRRLLSGGPIMSKRLWRHWAYGDTYYSDF